MNPISLSLDLLLMVLLLAALGFGWRLEQRLKALRESHADFTGAIADLDRAAQRAEVGLAQLRQATDEAVDLLAGRIEKARELSARLDKQVHEAGAIQPRPANDIHRPAAAAPGRARSAPVNIASPVDAVLAAESLARRLAGDEGLVLRQAAPASATRPTAPAPRALQRPRPSLDDDLFEAPAPARVAQAGLARRR